ncbi:methylenetetrahydrofolate reductase [Butyrivibrio sp. MC2013]|uniref:methylenetetrahydrofolate reductase n=1 Tax=Butyrivibrio sp. MC2013 TaxID=1280686 RepID=UPI000427F60B|nr:methylenetetrahydrofolate reductase [Butyrivibrio sp. MC2013]
MQIKKILEEDKVTISMEVFPPKKEDNLESVEAAACKIAELKPAFMSVTYGAAGTTRGYTLEVAKKIMDDTAVPVLPHLTSIASSKADVDDMLSGMKEAGINNIMALRGDPPKDGIVKDDFKYASDLVAYIRSGEFGKNLSVGGACYPEGHVESANKKEDLKYLKEKVDAGVDFLTTQMFFDNNAFYNFLYRAREAGITVPVLAGIMPITAARQLGRSVALSGTMVPPRFSAIVDHFGTSDEAMKQAGIIYASEQIIDLMANGIKHIHVYSMNKPDVAAGILDNLMKLL